ncbi:MAG: M48 family metallopeptidase [Rhodocyclaceae bacterium]|nr:M48 family metallopeptidase [Rhodocyclaceae bacterium]
MNFFESQERSRKHTTLLVVLFAVAVVALIIMTNLLVMVVFGFVNTQQLRDGEALVRQMDWQTFATVGVGVIVVVLAGSFYKIMALSGGGRVVAESLGGQLLPPNTEDLNQRKLLNVVEEMAIASGTPVPPVYLLADEPGINAFAAGFSPSDAVIGVTQGAIDQLNRDQLQGVIAHEFSHIFNGDMRLNIRLMGALNGILVLGMLGYYLLYSTSFSGRRRGNSKDGGAILALALGLIVIGFAGTFFGGLIKAAVSRQREYLADASAVQFTRSPDGIAGALKRIGGLTSGSIVQNPQAPEVSHAFFAQGVSGFTQLLAATHPPLADRILRIDPQWNGKFDSSAQVDSDRADAPSSDSASLTGKNTFRKVATIAAATVIADAMSVIDRIGKPGQNDVKHARSLLEELPAIIREEAREPHGARAIIYSLVLDNGQEVRDRQLRHLQDHADLTVFALTLDLLPLMDGLDIKYRLPLIDIAIPALKQLSLDQYESFKRNLTALIEMDSRIDLLEWSLQKILFKNLDGQFVKLTPVKLRYSHPGQLQKETELVLSMMAHTGSQAQRSAEEAFDAAAEVLQSTGLALLPADQITIVELDQSLEKLEELKPFAKEILLKACVACVRCDQRTTVLEMELLRAFAGVLDCPIPSGMI